MNRAAILTSAALLGALLAPTATLAQEPGGPEADTSVPRPVAPVVVGGACPFECCQYGAWTLLTPVVARARPTRGAPVAARLPAGTRVRADTGFVRLDTLGLVVVTAPYPERTNDHKFTPGDTLVVLDYLGEGFFNAWFRGRAIQTEVFWLGDSGARSTRVARELQAPAPRWWVRMRNRRGVGGWVEMTRRVDVRGADACG